MIGSIAAVSGAVVLIVLLIVIATAAIVRKKKNSGDIFPINPGLQEDEDRDVLRANPNEAYNSNTPGITTAANECYSTTEDPNLVYEEIKPLPTTASNTSNGCSSDEVNNSTGLPLVTYEEIEMLTPLPPSAPNPAYGCNDNTDHNYECITAPPATLPPSAPNPAYGCNNNTDHNYEYITAPPATLPAIVSHQARDIQQPPMDLSKTQHTSRHPPPCHIPTRGL